MNTLQLKSKSAACAPSTRPTTLLWGRAPRAGIASSKGGTIPSKVGILRCPPLAAGSDTSVQASSSGDGGDGFSLRQPPSRQLPSAMGMPRGGSFDSSLSSLSVDDLPTLVDASLPPPPDLQGKNSRARWNATHFAFMGDAVWEVYMRRFFFHPPTRNTDYSSNVEGACRAEAQSEILANLMGSGFLQTEELDIVRWARNAKLQHFPKRFKAAGSEGEDGRAVYRDATCLETLVGYLYVTCPSRLEELMRHLGYI